MNASDKRRLENLIETKIDRRVRQRLNKMESPDISDVPKGLKATVERAIKLVTELYDKGVYLSQDTYKKYTVKAQLRSTHPLMESFDAQCGQVKAAGEALKEQLVMELYGADADAQDLLVKFEVLVESL